MDRILVACDSFKGSLSSVQAVEAVGLGLLRAKNREGISGEGLPSAVGRASEKEATIVTHCPMSDGGDGLIDSLTFPCSGKGRKDSSSNQSSRVPLQRIAVPASWKVHSPLGSAIPVHETPVSFACNVRLRVIVVEMAEAAGLSRIPSPKNRSPWEATSYGVGDVIRYALRYMFEAIQREEGLTEPEGVVLLLGIGGSATNDGGLGALQSLGLEIFVENSGTSSMQQLKQPFCGKHLSLVRFARVSEQLLSVFLPRSTSPKRADACFVRKMFLICDVANPLAGPCGATYVFGPQKCSPVIAGSGDTEDSAVGTVKSVSQQSMLDLLEAGMKQAAGCVVHSTYKSIIRGESCEPREEKALLEELLHGSHGGGAGGMSGFFRYLLGAESLPGTDVVAGLLGLRVVEDLPWLSSSTSSATSRSIPRGLLYTPWRLLATGEGSFDAQSIYSRKTVGRLLEMVLEAQVCQWKSETECSPTSEERTGTHCPVPKREVVVVCGRCGFQSQGECMEALKAVVLGTRGRCHPSCGILYSRIEAIGKAEGISLDKVVDLAMPTVQIIILTHHFSVQESMKNTFQCIVNAVETADKAASFHLSHV